MTKDDLVSRQAEMRGRVRRRGRKRRQRASVKLASLQKPWTPERLNKEQAAMRTRSEKLKKARRAKWVKSQRRFYHRFLLEE